MKANDLGLLIKKKTKNKKSFSKGFCSSPWLTEENQGIAVIPAACPSQVV